MLSTTGCLSILQGEAVSKDAESLPEAERAVLLGRSQWYLVWGRDISIHAVAGETDLRRAEVAPGLHTVVVDHTIFVGGAGGAGLCSFTLNLQPGHQYQFRSVDNHDRFFAQQTHNKFTIDIEDIPPGEKQGVVIRLPCEVYPPATPPAEAD